MDIHDDTPDRGESPRDGSPKPVQFSLSEAAMLLGVATSTLSQAARNGWQCAGHYPREWAVYENGRIVRYNIPPEVLAELAAAKAVAQSSHPSPDSVPYEPTYAPHPLSSMPAPAQMPAPWPPQMGGYGTGYAPPLWPPAAPAVTAAPTE